MRPRNSFPADAAEEKSVEVPVRWEDRLGGKAGSCGQPDEGEAIVLLMTIRPLTLLVALGLMVLPGCDPRDTTVESDGSATVESLFQVGRSNEFVEVSGIVQRTLSDDNEGSRHQRFIVRLSTGRTLLIAHNLDLADRVPLEVGDEVRVLGEYEWNEQGGVLHWTHHDPAGDILGGWIEHDGRRYR